MIKQRDVAIVVIAALVGAVTMGSVMSLLHLKSGVAPAGQAA